jgi:CubicO group peptidase (beta-lactamase class C family)
MTTVGQPTSALRDALQEALGREETGVQICAYRHGELIADGWAGTMGDAAGTPVDGQTLFPVFSTSKAVTATALHVQAERGLVDYDAPLATYWPEYGNRGKERITVRHVLTHRAGVPQMPDDVTPERLGDWEWMVQRLAEAEPVFEPGTHNTYLSMTFGWLLGEVVRRTDPQGRPFARFVAEEVCAPLRMDSFFFGIHSSDEARVATLSFPNQPDPPPVSQRCPGGRAAVEATGVVPTSDHARELHDTESKRGPRASAGAPRPPARRGRAPWAGGAARAGDDEPHGRDRAHRGRHARRPAVWRAEALRGRQVP